MRKSLSVLMSIFIAAGLVGCSFGEAKTQDISTKTVEANKDTKTNNEKVKIRMMYWNKEETMQPFLDLAKEKLPNIEIEFNFVSVDQFMGTLETQLQAGEGPDLIPTAENESHIKAGYLIDLSEEEFIKNYSDASLDAISVDGKIYGIPGVSWFEGIFYNKDIFKENNLEIPKTFDEMMEVHKVLKEKGILPQAFGAKSWEPLAKSPLGLAIVDYLQTDAGKDFDVSIRNGVGKFSDSALKDSINRWLAYVDNGYITKDMLQIDYDTALKQFATGEAAMWESGPWAINAILETNPDLNFDMMPFVGTNEGNEYLIGGSGVNFGVNAGSENQKEALEVLKLMATKEGQQALCQGSPGSGSFLKGADIGLPKQFESVREVLNSGRVYCPWFVWKGSDAYNEALGKGIQEVIGGNMTVDQVLEDMDQKVKEQMMLRE